MRHWRSVGCRYQFSHSFHYQFGLIKVDPVPAFVRDDVPSANRMCRDCGVFIESNLWLMPSGKYSHGNLRRE